MKAGDLVELSAFGKKMKRNTHRGSNALGKIGIVVANVACDAMHVRWLGDYMSMRTDWHRRDELKHAK